MSTEIKNYVVYDVDLKQHLPFNVDELKGWGTNFVIAGGFIHDIVHGMEPNDIDIWIFTTNGFIELLSFFSKSYTDINYKIYPSVIEINSPDFKYPIQLINSINEGDDEEYKTKIWWGHGETVAGAAASRVISMFDMDYTRCFFDGKNTYVFTECLNAWSSKVIRDVISYDHLRSSRILKAHKKGYQIEKKMASGIGMPMGHPRIIWGHDKPQPFWSEAIPFTDDYIKKLEESLESPLSEHMIIETKDLNVVKKYFYHTVVHNIIRESGSNYEIVPQLDGDNWDRFEKAQAI